MGIRPVDPLRILTMSLKKNSVIIKYLCAGRN